MSLMQRPKPNLDIGYHLKSRHLWNWSYIRGKLLLQHSTFSITYRKQQFILLLSGFSLQNFCHKYRISPSSLCFYPEHIVSGIFCHENFFTPHNIQFFKSLIGKPSVNFHIHSNVEHLDFHLRCAYNIK